MSDIPADWRGQLDLRAEIARIDREKTFEAYSVTRISDGVIVYIGITSRGMKRRISQHQCKGPTTKRYALAAAIRKHGAAAFAFEVVACATDAQNLNEVERLLISQHGTLAPNGYNLTTGGNQAFEVSEETRAKIGAASKQRGWSSESRLKLSRTTKGRPGRTQTAEERERRSQAYLGRKHSEETRQKMSDLRKGKPGRLRSEAEASRLRTAWVGRQHTAATRAKMSESHRGKTKTAEHRAALSAAFKGRNKGVPLSPEARERLRLANIGRPCSPETRAKIGAANCARRAAAHD